MRFDNGIIFHVRSSEATKISQGTLNSHIQVKLPEPIVPGQDEFITMKLISAEIPYSFYNVSDNLDNNVITYDNTEKIHLLNKNYSASELIKYLNNLSEQPFKFSYDVYTSKVTIQNTDIVDHTINFEIGNVRSVLGAKNQSEIIPAGLSKELESILDLCSIHCIYVCTSLSSGNVVSTNSSNSEILQKIQVQNNSGSIIYLDLDSYITVSNLKGGIIDQFDILLKDQQHKLIDMMLCEYELSIVFERVKKEKASNIEIETPRVPMPTFTNPIPQEISAESAGEPENEVEDLLNNLRIESGLEIENVE